jgi:hypothetical protein
MVVAVRAVDVTEMTIEMMAEVLCSLALSRTASCRISLCGGDG